MKASLLNLVESQVSKFRQMTGLSDSEAVNLKSLLFKLNVLLFTDRCQMIFRA